MEEDHVILGVHVTDRMTEAGAVQAVLTEYGCHIKTRLGLHRADETACSPQGLILLEIFGGESIAREMTERLSAITGVDVQTMVFSHPH